MNMRVTKASGRGQCAECSEPIAIGEKQLVKEQTGFYLSGRYCNKCSINYLKRSVEINKRMLKQLKSK